MCDVKFCRKDRTMGYFGHGVCDDCYKKHCDNDIDLKKEFNIIKEDKNTYGTCESCGRAGRIEHQQDENVWLGKCGCGGNIL